ncbi:MAG: ferrous iron transporter B [Oscillospiraceae bacterium]
MSLTIALAGNPNCGKTTLFNTLTGSSQYVGNWPGVTVEKKEGRLKGEKDVKVTDLPGIYSLSPYTLEEVVSRNYLLAEKPDVILNIVDASNIERNLYLTTQLAELGTPMIVALNMMDIVKKRGDKIDTAKLSEVLGCPVVEITAVKGEGSLEAAKTAIAAAKSAKTPALHRFSESVETAVEKIAALIAGAVEENRLRWYAVKLFERDEKANAQLKLDVDLSARIEAAVADCESALDDDSESIITGERYDLITGVIGDVSKKKTTGLSASDKIDRIVTNRFLALPIFAVVMFLVYFLSVSTVGTIFTDWANDGVFGDGWHLAGIGSSDYADASEEFAVADAQVSAFEAAADEQGISADTATNLTAVAEYENEDGEVSTYSVDFSAYTAAAAVEEPDPADYGVWVTGVPVLAEKGLDAIHAAPWVQDLTINGIIAGVGAVLGFLPQMLVLFFLLALLEDCGYMARVAFIMDRIFRRFGLSGKSFIPMLVASGCGVPGVMASRTIENEKDRKMTIMLTTFIPCGAKIPVIALIAGAMFDNASWVATSGYFVGIAAIIFSGVILKKSKAFAGEPAPFVMELPTYHIPGAKGVFIHMWDRAKSFVIKAGTIIFIACALIWFLSSYGFTDGSFGAVDGADSLLAAIGGAIAVIFTPLGWGNWQSAVAAISGLVAKENVVGTFGVMFRYNGEVAENGEEIWSNLQSILTPLAAYSFLVFNLLCAPCFAAIGAIRREMGSAKWTFIAIGYQTGLAYIAALCIYQLGRFFTGGGLGIGTAIAFAVAAAFVFLLVKPYREHSGKLTSVRAVSAK